jgi:hypothetical protein
MGITVVHIQSTLIVVRTGNTAAGPANVADTDKRPKAVGTSGMQITVVRA